MHRDAFVKASFDLESPRISGRDVTNSMHTDAEIITPASIIYRNTDLDHQTVVSEMRTAADVY